MPITMLRLEAHLWLYRLKRRDVEILAEVGQHFPATSGCFDCDQPIGMGRIGLTVLQDDKATNWVIIVAVCGRCTSSPERRERQEAMMTATFGWRPWHPENEKPAPWAAYLTKRKRR